MCRSISFPYLQFCGAREIPNETIGPNPWGALKVDSSVDPFVVFVTNVLYQLLVFGCLAIANVAFGNCGVLRL